MIRLRALSIALCLGLAAPAAWAADPVLVIHGGAGLERKDVTPQDEAAIRAALEPPLARLMGAPVPVFVRDAAELAAILAANPFPAADPSRLHVLFLQAAPRPDPMARARNRVDEEVACGRREIYLHTPSGIGRSRLRLPELDEGTARNLNTVARLAALTAA